MTLLRNQWDDSALMVTTTSGILFTIGGLKLYTVFRESSLGYYVSIIEDIRIFQIDDGRDFTVQIDNRY